MYPDLRKAGYEYRLKEHLGLQKQRLNTCIATKKIERYRNIPFLENYIVFNTGKLGRGFPREAVTLSSASPPPSSAPRALCC